MAPQTRSRYRENVTLVPSSLKIYQPNGILWSTAHGTGTIQTRFEYISDVVGSSDRVHPVRHDTVTLVPLPETNLTAADGWHDVRVDRYHALPGGVIEELFLNRMSHLDLGDLHDKAYEALWPQIPQEVSVPNFIYELRDVLSLLPTLQEGIVKSAAGGYLNYQFGWKPFIGDIQKLRGLMTTIKARLEYLKSTWGRETRISYQTSFPVDAISDVEISGYRFTASGRGIFRASGYLYHKLEDLDGLIGEYRALLGATGFNNPLGVIWEAIPFSFVADWFGRVGNAVSRTPIQPFVGPWEIRRLTHSWDIGGEFEGYLPVSPGYNVSKWVLWRGKVRYYSRDIGLPVSTSVLFRDGLNPQQQALGAALLAGVGR